MKLSRLLVVIDARHDEQPALQRAAWLARRHAASLDLLLVEYHSGLAAAEFFDSARQERARLALLEQRRAQLERLAEPLLAEGLQVTREVRWGRPKFRLILERLAETGADLVLKSSHRRSLLQRTWLGNSAWQLIRHCPAPLWLCQPGEWRGQHLAAALDPLHDADQPAQLDHQLIAAALALQDALRLDAHFLHCHAPLPRSLVFDEELVLDYQHYVERSDARHRQAFEQLLAPYRIAEAHGHLLEGFPEEAIPRFVRERQIDLLLTGAVSRGHLEDALIGHTAERLLDGLACDLLVLKPDAARSASEQ